MKIRNPVLTEAVALARSSIGNGGPSKNEERHQCSGGEKPKVRYDQNDQRPPSVVNVVSVVRPVLENDAYHGVAGDVVNTIVPHTEADPVAILLQVLTYAGNIIGRYPYYQIEADRHHANLFSVLVGESAKGRKGRSGGRARSVFKTADPNWIENRMKSGLSSGEGLINEVRDERKEWNKKEQCEEVVDPGIADKRLIVTEAELAKHLIEIAEQDDDGAPKTGRRYYYLALSYGYILPDMGDSPEGKKSRDAAYKRVTDVLGVLRKQWRLGWDMVLDLTRNVEQWETYESARDARAQLRRQYTEDRWLGQR
jgi:hypothetical protein